MIPSAFDEENNVLDGPPGTTSDEVIPLSVFHGFVDAQGRLADEGQPVVVSCWKPTREELDEIQRTGRCWLLILGHTMPPAVPVGISPFRKS